MIEWFVFKIYCHFALQLAAMEIDDKLKWLELRINSSLKPRNEDVKNMFANDDNRLVDFI